MVWHGWALVMSEATSLRVWVMLLPQKNNSQGWKIFLLGKASGIQMFGGSWQHLH